jgi:serine phosphatase RsbU (regulator of sigma subunit)
LSAEIIGQVDSAYFVEFNKRLNDIIDNGNYALATEKVDSLLLVSEKNNFKIGIADAYNYKGIINRDQSNLKNALDNYLNALTMFEKLKLSGKVAGAQNNIGLIYAEIKEYKTALAYYFKAVKINLTNSEKKIDSSDKIALEKLSNIKLNLAINYNNIATCYQKLKQPSSAQTYLNRSLAIRSAEKDTVGMAMAYHNIGLNYQLKKMSDSSVICFNLSLGYLSSMGENIGHAYNYLELGNTYLQQGKLNEAEGYLLNSLRIADKSDLEGLKVENYKYLSKLYSLKNDFKSAYKFQELFLSSKELIESDENKNEILKKELEYDFNKRQELQRLEAENKQAVSNAEIKSQKKLTTYAIIALVVLSGLIVIVLRSYNQKRKANFIISKQKELVEHKNKEIVDSINYAKYIQTALLPSDKIINDLPFECSVLFKPKDIVSGDFYWVHQNKNKSNAIYIAAVDCTGHGVPGALVSVVGNNGLNRCVEEFGITETGNILDKLTELVEDTFENSANELKDGMDISLLKIDLVSPDKIKVQWSGANNPLWIIKNSASSSGVENKELIEVKADKQPIGKFINKNAFKSHYFEFQKGDRVYLFTDGYADQFGGPKGKKFKYKQLEDLLIATSRLSLNNQKAELDLVFNNWKKNLEQVDDVCVIGIQF